MPEHNLSLYSDQLSQLFSMRRTTRERTLHDMRQMLRVLQDPTQHYPIVQIVGTNGKGSTAAFLATMLESAGYRTGLFTSPHLISFCERFRVANQTVDDQQLAPLLSHVLELTYRENIEPVFFDVTTLMATLLFAQEQVDIAIFEAGMGGRLDATTALPAEMVILTEVGHDHNTWIGPTLEDIARDKSAAFRPHKPAILGAISPHLQQIARDEAEYRVAHPIWGVGHEFPDLSATSSSAAFQLPDGADIRWWNHLSPNLSGSFQRRNLGLALVAQHLLAPLGFSCSPDAIEQGISHVHWPARRQKLTVEGHPFWLDGAHNAHGMQALADSFDARSICMIFGAMLDKDIPALIQPFVSRLHTLILTPIQQARAATPQELQNMLAPVCRAETSLQQAPSLQEAMTMAFRCFSVPVKPPDLVLVCGSLMLAGELLAWLDTLDRP